MLPPGPVRAMATVHRPIGHCATPRTTQHALRAPAPGFAPPRLPIPHPHHRVGSVIALRFHNVARTTEVCRDTRASPRCATPTGNALLATELLSSAKLLEPSPLEPRPWLADSLPHVCGLLYCETLTCGLFSPRCGLFSPLRTLISRESESDAQPERPRPLLVSKCTKISAERCG